MPVPILPVIHQTENVSDPMARLSLVTKELQDVKQSLTIQEQQKGGLTQQLKEKEGMIEAMKKKEEELHCLCKS